MDIASFQAVVWRYHLNHGRHGLSWRLPDPDGSFDPYKILVSEVMLQQTQVQRVLPKYAEFLERFPTVQHLAKAELGDVLVAWQGLGYNRRAKYLWQAAQKVVADHKGSFPQSQQELVKLPGVGVNTAGAVMAYAYDQPVVFVETNIRTVFIHSFFADQDGITDKAVLKLVGDTLPGSESTRVWYWALMDYGVHLKHTVGNKSRASKTYVRQSPFEGSRRQVRGAVVRELGDGAKDSEALRSTISDPRLEAVLFDLVQEGMIQRDSSVYRLSGGASSVIP